LLRRIDAEALELEARGGFARAELHAPVRDEIERGDARRDLRGMAVAGRHQHDAVAEPDPLRALRARREEDLRRRGVRVLLEEVVLDLPGVTEAEPVGQLDLGERVLEQALLVALAPRPRQLVLVEDAELHGLAPPHLEATVVTSLACGSLRAPLRGACVAQ